MSIRDRLENWAEAAWWGIGGYGGTSIGSLEGRYRAKRRDDDEEPPRKIKPEPDFNDADIINAAWLRLPRREKFFLKFLYINNANVGFICRKLHIRSRPTSCFEIERAKIEKFLENRLVNRKILVQNVVTI